MVGIKIRGIGTTGMLDPQASGLVSREYRASPMTGLGTLLFDSPLYREQGNKSRYTWENDMQGIGPYNAREARKMQDIIERFNQQGGRLSQRERIDIKLVRGNNPIAEIDLNERRGRYTVRVHEEKMRQAEKENPNAPEYIAGYHEPAHAWLKDNGYDPSDEPAAEALAAYAAVRENPSAATFGIANLVGGIQSGRADNVHRASVRHIAYIDQLRPYLYGAFGRN